MSTSIGAVQVHRVDARCYKQQLSALFQRRQKPELLQQFDWYYRAEGQPTPISWVAQTADGYVCGLYSVTMRPLQYGGTTLHAGVMGNLIVEAGSRSTFAPFNLVRACKELIRNHDLDILLGIPNELAEPWLVKNGFRVLGYWDTWAQVFRCGEALQHRFGRPGRLGAPLLNLAAQMNRTFSEWTADRQSAFQAIFLNSTELDDLDIEHWATRPDSFAFAADPLFLRWRFLKSPMKHYDVVGIADSRTKRLQGYVVVESRPGRWLIWDCRTNTPQLSERDAILTFCRSKQAQASTISITQLSSAPLAQELSRHGFVRVPQRLGGYPRFPLIAFWSPDHPLAAAFPEIARCNIFPGFNDL